MAFIARPDADHNASQDDAEALGRGVARVLGLDEQRRAAGL
jgi:hypothetical protein